MEHQLVLQCSPASRVTRRRPTAAVLAALNSTELLVSNSNASTWLTVPSSQLGSCCNCIGTSVSIFADNLDLCSSPFATCMQNQISARLASAPASRFADLRVRNTSIGDGGQLAMVWRPASVLTAVVDVALQPGTLAEPYLFGGMDMWTAGIDVASLCNANLRFVATGTTPSTRNGRLIFSTANMGEVRRDVRCCALY